MSKVEISIEKLNLTKNQKDIVLKLYQNYKNDILEIVNKIQNNDSSEITKNIFELICLGIKIVEKIKINRKRIDGATKKLVVIELIRVVIKEEIKNETVKANVLTIYNLTGENVLETIIDVSNNVNLTQNCLKFLVVVENNLNI